MCATKLEKILMICAAVVVVVVLALWLSSCDKPIPTPPAPPTPVVVVPVVPKPVKPPCPCPKPCKPEPKPVKPSPVAPKAPPEIKVPPVVKCSVLAFTASWCYPCREAHPKVVAARMRGLDITEIDVDAYPKEVKDYKVTSVPTFVVFYDGKETSRTNDVNDVVALID